MCSKVAQMTATIAKLTADNTWLSDEGTKLARLVSKLFEEKLNLVKCVRELERKVAELTIKLASAEGVSRDKDVDYLIMYNSANKHAAAAEGALKTLASMSADFASVVLEVVATHGDASLKSLLAR
jgi:hypothetical protein